MPVFRGQTTAQQNLAVTSLIVAFFRLLTAYAIALMTGFSLAVFTWSTVTLQFVVIFFVSYFIHSFLDRGFDRAFLNALMCGVFAGAVTALASSTATFSVLVNAVLAPAIGLLFLGVFIVEIVLEYLRLSAAKR